MTGAHSNCCTKHFDLLLLQVKSNIRLPSKQPQTPELAYDYFRTVISATSNQYDINLLIDTCRISAGYEVGTLVHVVSFCPRPCCIYRRHLYSLEKLMVFEGWIFLVLALTVCTQVDLTLHTVSSGSGIGAQMTKTCVICGAQCKRAG